MIKQQEFIPLTTMAPPSTKITEVLKRIANQAPQSVVDQFLSTLVSSSKLLGKNEFRYETPAGDVTFEYVDSEGFKSAYRVINDNTIGDRKVPFDVFYKPDADALIDVGAHHGVYSTILATLNPQASLYCFEPDEYNRSRLKQTLRHNNIEATIRSEVVTDYTGEITFYKWGEASQSHSTIPPVQDGIEVSLPCVSLVDMMREHNLTSPFLKIDAEGEEYNILRDLAENTPSGTDVTGYVELHPSKLDEIHVNDVYDLFESYNIHYETVGEIAEYPRPAYRFSFTHG